jgi:MFS family permease
LSNFIEYTVIPISIISLITCFSYSGILTFISFYASQINLAEAAQSFFLVYALIILLSRPFFGRLLDLKGANIVAYPTLAVFAIGMFLFSQAGSGMMLLLSGAIIGLGFGNFQSCSQTISIKVAPSDRLGLATSTYYILSDIGYALGPYLTGLLIPYTGCRVLFLMMAFMILISIILYYFLYGRRSPKE